MRRGFIYIFIFIVCFFIISPLQAETTSVNVTFHAALVDKNLTVRPIPRFAFTITDVNGEQKTLNAITSFEGQTTFVLQSGKYYIVSVNPIVVEGQSYMWNIKVDIPPQPNFTIELSNDNATITTDIAKENAVTKTNTVSDLFIKLRPSIAKVETEVGSGTAFLISNDGLYLTNAHVISGSRTFIIWLPTNERYWASLIFSDAIEDIAVLRIHPDIVKNITPLSLAADSPAAPVIHEGQRAFALGSPLAQKDIITTGIISKIETGALISDVSIDPGNSGGPLVNERGDVIGINTFGAGRSVSGTIRIWKAFPIIEEAKKRLNTMTLPPLEKLPDYPETRYPVDALKNKILSNEFKLTDYHIATRTFDIYFLTPPAKYYYEYKDEIEMAKGRAKRYKGKSVDKTYDPTGDMRSWGEYAGQYKAVVTVVIEPKTSATGGSVLGAILLGTSAVLRYQYQGDFDRMVLSRGSQVVTPVKVSRNPLENKFKGQQGSMADVAYRGYIEFLPDAFQPSTKKNEEVTIEIVNEADSKKTIREKVPQDILRRIWDDFSPLRVPTIKDIQGGNHSFSFTVFCALGYNH